MAGRHGYRHPEGRGITTAVRYVIDATANTNGKGMTAADVRDKLASLGWDWERYVKPLATVHKVLTRLAASGAIKEVADGCAPRTRRKQ
jgi:hypothetical protein